jgi:hypothetical protein
VYDSHPALMQPARGSRNCSICHWRMDGIHTWLQTAQFEQSSKDHPHHIIIVTV